MKFLFDTNAVIRLLNNDQQFIAKLKRFHPKDFAIPSIAFFELWYGAERSRKVAENIQKLEKLRFQILPFTAQDAVIAGKIRADLEKRGTPIGAYDVQIAAQAVSNNLILITHNVREFKRIENLNYEDWQAEDTP